MIKQLTTLGLLKRFQPLLFSVGYDAIDERIETICRGEWLQSSSASLEGMVGWFRQEIGVWLLKVLEAADQCMVSSSNQPGMSRVIEIVRPAMSRFEYHIYKSLSELRSATFLSGVLPSESWAGINDLTLCRISIHAGSMNYLISSSISPKQCQY
jgi:anaphase-promoting complex subunit 2